MILCMETISGKIKHFGVVVANSKHLFKLKNDIQFFSPQIASYHTIIGCMCIRYKVEKGVPHCNSSI